MRLTRHGKVALLIAAAVVVTATVWAVPGMVRSAQRTSSLTAVADQIVVPSDWVETIHETTSPQNPCLGMPCPSVYLRWDTPKQITVADFERLIDRSGFYGKVKGDCERQDPTGGGTELICSTDISAHGVRVSMGATNDGSGGNTFDVIVTE